MKEIKSSKNNPLKKIFIKLCRILGFEIIDQSNFYVPTSNKSLDQGISVPGKRSINLPLGKVNITRPVKRSEKFSYSLIELRPTHVSFSFLPKYSQFSFNFL